MPAEANPIRETDPLEVGQRVRYFTPHTCWYHGKPGTVVSRRLTEDGHYEYEVAVEGSAFRSLYHGQGIRFCLVQCGLYGVERWEQRPLRRCGFGCEERSS